MVRQTGLNAKRFILTCGDLEIYEGRAALWQLIEKEEPEAIWVSLECKAWGNYSRFNMGRSVKTRQKILVGRERERVHLKLCNELYLHQVALGRHFHLEQP